jgi:hypothetical protein
MKRTLCAVLLLAPVLLPAQQPLSLPQALSADARVAIERIIDSARTIGLPVAPLYDKAGEGKLKQAPDAQIVVAVRALSARLGAVRAGLGASLDESSMMVASTALAAGIAMDELKQLRREAGGDFAIAVVTATDLIGSRATPRAAIAAVNGLVAKHATVEQYARLRSDVAGDVGQGRGADQSIRARVDAIMQGAAKPPEQQ